MRRRPTLTAAKRAVSAELAQAIVYTGIEPMKRIFSTDEVHPRDRFDFWHSVACATIVGHDSVPAIRNGFRADIDAGALAETSVVRFKNSQMWVSRTAAQIAKASSDEIFVCRQNAGSLSIDQDGHSAILQPGELVLLDPLLPYTADFSNGSESLAFKLPRRALETRLSPTRNLIGRPFGSGTGFQPWVSSFVANLVNVVGNLDKSAERVVQDQVLDLVALSLAEAGAGSSPRLTSSRSIALLAVRSAIDAHLSDPALTSVAVAQIAGISVRYANALLAAEGESVMSLVLARRLSRCKTALESRNQDHRTISDIALGWGFSDMTHFSRTFKAKYSMLPSECRKLAQSGRPIP